MTIRLLLADDQELVRSALCALLDLEEDFEVVASVGRGDEVTDAAKEHRPDVALLDIEMPGLDGLAAAAVLADQLPSCRVVMLTTFGRAGYLRRAMEAGAVGFVVKDAPAEVLAEAIRRVMAGERVVDPQLAAATLATGNSPLPLVNATCSAWPARARRWPRSPPSCTSRRVPSETTSRPPSPRPPLATGWTRSGSPTNEAGCRHLVPIGKRAGLWLVHPHNAVSRVHHCRPRRRVSPCGTSRSPPAIRILVPAFARSAEQADVSDTVRHLEEVGLVAEPLGLSAGRAVLAAVPP